ncbi:MAG: hypothetical protein WCA95_00035 [Opitutaceae bacterium]
MNTPNTKTKNLQHWGAPYILTLVLSLGLALAGCSRKILFQSDAIDNEVTQFTKQVWNDFEDRKWDALEDLAAKSIADQSKFGNGAWKIAMLHYAIAPSGVPNTNWSWYEEHIKDWERKYPRSVTARVEHVRFLTAYAWDARTTAEADKVKESAWPVFADRLAQAHEQLAIALKLGQRSPALWYAGFDVALGEGWPKKVTFAWFQAAKAAYPDYWIIDNTYYNYLLPRWYGEEGEWERIALAEIHRPGGTGEEGYARNVLQMERYYTNVFKETKVEWPLVKEGFQKLLQRYPDSQLILNQFAYAAVLAEDRETAIPLFKQIGVHADPGVWGSPADFKANRSWVYGGRY